jgi:2-oxoglutarate ferredoxin oxidoreductase subunit alpha
MNKEATDKNSTVANSNTPLANGKKGIIQLKEHIVEIISDSGEGAQKCGQSLGSIAAQMGNGIWTTEIIPAEIRPPARSIAGASGNRIRIGTNRVTNGGNRNRFSGCLQ